MKKDGFRRERYARVCGWCVLGALVVGGMIGLERDQGQERQIRQSQDRVVARELDGSETRVYILREFDGKVALFAPGQELPFQMTDISVTSLPYADQAALRRGLVLRGEEALRRTLEDFGS